MKKCEHCGTEYDPRDPDHVRAGGAGHLPWLCRDILKTQRDEAVAWQAAKQEWIDVATRTLATIPELTKERDAAHAAGREEALEAAAELCEREARACLSHAKAFRETNPKTRMTLAQAHEMAGQQSAACGHYIRALGNSRAHNVYVRIIGEPSDGALAQAKLMVNGYGVCQWPAFVEWRGTSSTGAEYAEESARVLREALGHAAIQERFVGSSPELK